MQLLEFVSISVGSAAFVTAILVLIAPWLALQTRRLIYPDRKTGQKNAAASSR